MGQHKHNPVAIAAKRGELPPKPPKPSKREAERMLYALVMKKLAESDTGKSIVKVVEYINRLNREVKGE